MAFPIRTLWGTGCLLATVLLSPTLSRGQAPGSERPVSIEAEAGGFAANTKTLPFWLRSNRFGIVPATAPAATFRAGAYRNYTRPDSASVRPRRFDWGFGFQTVANLGASARLLLPEAYVKVKYRALEFSGGRRRELIGLGDSTLSSGFIIGSGNALPIPKIQLATLGYVPLRFLRNFISIKAAFAHGWFNVPYIQGVHLHQKYLYFRLGQPGRRVNFQFGLNHQVQWGGHADYLKGSSVAVDGRLPSSFKYFGHVILATIPNNWGTGDYSSFDGDYRVGNHLGSWDFAVEIAAPGAQMLVYHQHPFEDVSGLIFKNIPDGLTGFSWSRKAAAASSGFGLQRVVVEVLSTMDQSGATFWIPGSSYQGADNYFNHGQYREGWSYFGRTIGTPFIAPRADLKRDVRENPGGGFFPNNRINAGYVGLEGRLSRVIWTARASWSRHFGNYTVPYTTPLNQFSALVSAQVPLFSRQRTFLNASVAFDRGDLLPTSTGGFLSVRKTF
ncbi:capsule assembly Wzi family protein [Larkinella soli]|uniref:capsule assembly Wzi family protein n=1 Tax=Larkinella soli TaxID=1770527 RepID=UPI000FFC3181|nr:capsule assembly Wzi family protein [Larkinella soli]